MKDDLKIAKVEYLSNHWLDLPEILNLNSRDQTETKNAWNEEDFRWKVASNGRRPPMEDNLQSKITSKNQKMNVSATTDWIFLKF